MKKDKNKLISQLIPVELFARLRAMLKALVVLIGLVWASLLLISWSGAIESQPPNQLVVNSTSSL